MSWNWLDVLVVLLAVGQIGMVIVIARIAGGIRRGAVARLSAVVGRNIVSGAKLVQTGRVVARATLPHLLHTRDSLAKIPGAFRPIELSDAPVSYHSLIRNVNSLRALQHGGRRVRGTARQSRVSLAERAGLVPPAWKRIAPLAGYAGTVLTIWREVRKQLPEIRRVLSERGSA